MIKRITTCGIGMALMLSTGAASAVEGVRINGFLTAAGTYTDADDNIYDDSIAANDLRFDGRDTRVGVQIAADVTERIGATLQLLARGGLAGGEDAFGVEANWAYVNYNFTDTAKLRAGRIKIPTFLTSDYIEVGYAYPWIRPPEEVYVLNPITTFSGVDMLITPTFGPVELLIQPYYGTTRDNSVVPPQLVDLGFVTPGTEKGDTLGFSAENLAGINLSTTLIDAVTLRLGYLRTDATVPSAGVDGETAQFLSLGASVDWRNIVAYAEYARRDADETAQEPTSTAPLAIAFPDQESWYLTFGYRIHKFLPHITYAQTDEGSDYFPTVIKQDSLTLGLRYEVANGAAFKFEAKRVEPKVENGVRNHGLFNNRLTEDSANVYGVALDVIF